MKRLIFSMLLIVGIALTSTAQKGTALATVVGDSVSTAASLDTVKKFINATAGYSTLAVQVNAVKVSGTITSKAYLYSSVDAVTYTLTDSSAAFANAAGAQSVFFTKTAPPYTIYKVEVRPPSLAPSTEVLAVKVWYALKRYD